MCQAQPKLTLPITYAFVGSNCYAELILNPLLPVVANPQLLPVVANPQLLPVVANQSQYLSKRF